MVKSRDTEIGLTGGDRGVDRREKEVELRVGLERKGMQER